MHFPISSPFKAAILVTNAETAAVLRASGSNWSSIHITNDGEFRAIFPSSRSMRGKRRNLQALQDQINPEVLNDLMIEIEVALEEQAQNATENLDKYFDAVRNQHQGS